MPGCEFQHLLDMHILKLCVLYACRLSQSEMLSFLEETELFLVFELWVLKIRIDHR